MKVTDIERAALEIGAAIQAMAPMQARRRATEPAADIPAALPPPPVEYVPVPLEGPKDAAREAALIEAMAPRDAMDHALAARAARLMLRLERAQAMADVVCSMEVRCQCPLEAGQLRNCEHDARANAAIDDPTMEDVKRRVLADIEAERNEAMRAIQPVLVETMASETLRRLLAYERSLQAMLRDMLAMLERWRRARRGHVSAETEIQMSFSWRERRNT